jgi:SAM-dependent methyltransferase
MGEDVRACPRCGKSEVYLKFNEPPFNIVRCRSCRLVYLGNPPSSETLYEDYYGDDPNPLNYRCDSVDSSLRELYAINHQRMGLVRQLVPAGKLLDVGCGRGFFLRTAMDYGYSVSGIDVSEKAVNYARKVFQVDAESVPIENLSGQQYDAVTLWHVLEHFVDPFIVLKQIRGMLSDGGVCIVEVPNLHSLKFMLAGKKWQGGNHPLYHRTFFTGKTLRETFSSLGFSKVGRVKISYHFPDKSGGQWIIKKALNLAAMDSFLDFAAWK